MADHVAPLIRAANLAAWLVVGALIAGAMLVANRLGFVGLFLIGGLTTLVCNNAIMDEHSIAPGMRRSMRTEQRLKSPEQKAMEAADVASFATGYVFCKRCGLVLMAAGAAGFVWQLYHLPAD